MKAEESKSLLLPTVHPNSVLPYHPEDYEDYVYEEYENQLENEEKGENSQSLHRFESTTLMPLHSGPVFEALIIHNTFS